MTFFLSGCVPSISEFFSTPPVKTRRVACIGDSITFGKGLTNREWNSYPSQLRRLLGYDWQVKNFGVIEATISKAAKNAYIHSSLFEEALAFKPNIVIFELGAFDTKQIVKQHSDLFTYDIKDLIEPFLSLETKPDIYICYPVPSCADEWDYNTISNKKIVSEIIPKLDKVAKENKLQIIDLYSALQSKLDLFPDCVHPNEQGASLIATNIYSSIVRSQYHPASGK